MKKEKFILLLIILSTLSLNVFPQYIKDNIDHMGKIESGGLIFQKYRHQVDPGPKGYNLDTKQNGIDLSLIHGLIFNRNSNDPEIFIGIGMGYLNFEGVNGFSIFADFQYKPSLEHIDYLILWSDRIYPLINIKYGYNHIRNQYENGTESRLTEIDLGLDYCFGKDEQIGVFVQSGFLMTQQAKFIHIRIGLRTCKSR